MKQSHHLRFHHNIEINLIWKVELISIEFKIAIDLISYNFLRPLLVVLKHNFCGFCGFNAVVQKLSIEIFYPNPSGHASVPYDGNVCFATF